MAFSTHLSIGNASSLSGQNSEMQSAFFSYSATTHQSSFGFSVTHLGWRRVAQIHARIQYEANR